MPICQFIPAKILGHVSSCPYTSRPSSGGRWPAPDLATARELVAASGTKGMRVTYWAGADAPDTLVSDRYVVRALRQLGYRARMRVVRGPRWFAIVSDAKRHPQAGTGALWGDYPSASQWLVFGLSCAAFDPTNPSHTFNDAEFCDPTVDRWAQQAISLETRDPSQAARLWARTDRRVTSLAPWVPAIQPSTTDLVSRRVGNYQSVPTIGALMPRMWVR